MTAWVMKNKSVFAVRWIVLVSLLATLLLAACQPLRQAPDPSSATPFVPPTLVPPTPVATPTVLAFAHSASSPGDCQDGLTFIQDATIPDGTQVEPGSTLDKRWDVQNSGTCAWNENYRIKLIAGDALGAASEQALFPTLGGGSTTIRITFQAPTEPGNYRSAWQAHDPAGQPFGDPFFIDFVVIDSPPPTSVP